MANTGLLLTRQILATLAVTYTGDVEVDGKYRIGLLQTRQILATLAVTYRGCRGRWQI